jgi:hypothetical protein
MLSRQGHRLQRGAGARPQRVATEAGRGQSGARRQRVPAAAGRSGSGAEMQRGRDAAGVAPAGRSGSGLEMLLGAAAAGRDRSGARLKRPAAIAGWGCGGEGMRRGGPSPPHSNVPLSAGLRRKRGRENKGSLPYPPFPPLSLSLSHLTSSSPWMNNPPPLPSPQPTSSSLYGRSESPPFTRLSLAFFRYLFILPFPFLVPSSFHVSLSLSLSLLLPFSLFPSLSPTIPVTSPNPIVFP